MSAQDFWVPSNPYIHTKKTSFMQRLSDRVRRGARLYVWGQTPLKGVPQLVSKLDQKWPLNLTKMQASRRRKAGHGSYHWLGWWDDQSELVHWFVLLNPGSEIDKTETWRDVVEDRLNLTGYELVRHTRSGKAAPAWTWRYSKVRLRTIRDALVSSIRCRRDLEAEQIMTSLFKSPGFGGVREQVKKLRQLAIAEWQRNRSNAEIMFPLPKTIGYVSRLADKGVTWSALMPNGSKTTQRSRPK